MQHDFDSLAFRPADILLPEGGYEKWSVVACDQYTSQPEYWDRVDRLVGGAPSALRIILPEARLGDDRRGQAAAIDAVMREYLQKGLFKTYPDSFVYVERRLTTGGVRRGLVGEFDLEAYDYRRGSGTLIRATEGTVLERIPPRVEIRRGAPLEIPHVMMLIDDPEDSVIGAAQRACAAGGKLYDFDLMEGGGHITGRRVSGAGLEKVAQAVAALESKDVFAGKYGAPDSPVLAYAVGDGNHSLAAAKSCWEEIKKDLTPEQAETHPARFALAELVNIRDAALDFEPVHRAVFGVEPQRLLTELKKYYPEACENAAGPAAGYVYAGGEGRVAFGRVGLAVGLLQDFLDDYVSRFGGTIDYIHGDDVARSLGRREGAISFLLPAIGKSEFFAAIIRDGALPRKTFSMGRAQDKRFYLESRKISR
jgi:hypothetical protein